MKGSIEVWRLAEGVWWWTCWECVGTEGFAPDRDFQTHPEALAAGLEHCAKARR